MGGMITALTAIDPRLKAVAPFVGGTGFKDVDFPGGIVGSSKRLHFQNLECTECNRPAIILASCKMSGRFHHFIQ